jgi:hypothetical protein
MTRREAIKKFKKDVKLIPTRRITPEDLLDPSFEAIAYYTPKSISEFGYILYKLGDNYYKKLGTKMEFKDLTTKSRLRKLRKEAKRLLKPKLAVANPEEVENPILEKYDVNEDYWPEGVGEQVKRAYEIIRKSYPEIPEEFVIYLLKYYAHSQTADYFYQEAYGRVGEDKEYVEKLGHHFRYKAKRYLLAISKYYGIDAEEWWEKMPPEVSDLVEKIIEKWNEVPMEYKKKYKENPVLDYDEYGEGWYDEYEDYWPEEVQKKVKEAWEIIKEKHPEIPKKFAFYFLKSYAYTETAEKFYKEAETSKGKRKKELEELADFFYYKKRKNYLNAIRDEFGVYAISIWAPTWWEKPDPEASDLVEKIVEKWNEVPLEYKKKYKENPAELLVINPFGESEKIYEENEKIYEETKNRFPFIPDSFIEMLLEYRLSVLIANKCGEIIKEALKTKNYKFWEKYSKNVIELGDKYTKKANEIAQEFHEKYGIEIRVVNNAMDIFYLWGRTVPQEELLKQIEWVRKHKKEVE